MWSKLITILLQFFRLYICLFIIFLSLSAAPQEAHAQEKKKMFTVKKDRKQPKVKVPKNKQAQKGTNDKYKRPRSKKRSGKAKDTYAQPRSKSISTQAKDNYSEPRSKKRSGKAKDDYNQPRSKSISTQAKDNYSEPRSKKKSGIARDNYSQPRSKSISTGGRDNYQPPPTVSHSGVVRDTYKRPRSKSRGEEVKVEEATVYDSPPIKEGAQKDVKPLVGKNAPSVYYKFAIYKKQRVQGKAQKKYFEKLSDKQSNHTSIKLPTRRAEAKYYKKLSEEVHTFNGVIKNRKAGKDMHPSVEYLGSKTKSSYEQKENYRKRKVFWSHIFRKNDQPKHLDEKPRKPRYDKGESEIWFD